MVQRQLPLLPKNVIHPVTMRVLQPQPSSQKVHKLSLAHGTLSFNVGLPRELEYSFDSSVELTCFHRMNIDKPIIDQCFSFSFRMV